MPAESFYKYLPDGVSFTSKQATTIKTIYAPLCGTDTLSIKSAITPFLSGDIKIDKFHYLTKPASREDLRQPLREFFIFIKDKGVFSLSQESSPDSASVEIGPLWHKLKRTHQEAGLEIGAINFIPVTGENIELMQVTVKNISKKSISFTPTSAIALFGRSLANKHDHEHVTALLNRVKQVPEGVLMQATMAFNEEGHKTSHCVYYVYGCQDKAGGVTGSFPTVDSFYGDGGSMARPQAVFENRKPVTRALRPSTAKKWWGHCVLKKLNLSRGKASHTSSRSVQGPMKLKARKSSISLIPLINLPRRLR